MGKETSERERGKREGKLGELRERSPYFGVEPPLFFSTTFIVLKHYLALESSLALGGSMLEHGLSPDTSSALVDGMLKCKVLSSSEA